MAVFLEFKPEGKKKFNKEFEPTQAERMFESEISNRAPVRTFDNLPPHVQMFQLKLQEEKNHVS